MSSGAAFAGQPRGTNWKRFSNPDHYRLLDPAANGACIGSGFKHALAICWTKISPCRKDNLYRCLDKLCASRGTFKAPAPALEDLFNTNSMSCFMI